ncbi:response regulator transcription factor [Taibaiella lutea]|uniref:Response regulator transcription factor n=1 Tax=Taibaiella lutea TaxID=2608001 RepID=A0A5M6CIL2_9BACT|nr:LytTR family DNA-binding domain-containing protein [Taibaiella lutea]KAA5534853.1 response regulator transcription factor [Taibaiella lutea]
MQNSSRDRLKVIIVDDEPTACNNLKNTLLQHIDRNIDICAIAHNTEEATYYIQQYKPDALFLDIEMPAENAFHFLERIYPFDFEIVFVTAFDEYAVRAFKLNAIDYILKPISITEIRQATDRLLEKIVYKKLTEERSTEYKELVAQMTGNYEPKKIFLKELNNIVAVAFADIYFIEAMGSYSKLNFLRDGKEQQIVMSHSIAEYEDLLPKDVFFRIHKSYLINCRYIKKVTKDHYVSLEINDTYHIPVSRRRYPFMLEFIKTYELNKK